MVFAKKTIFAAVLPITLTANYAIYAAQPL